MSYRRRSEDPPLPDLITVLERHLVTEAMNATHQNVARAAVELGVSRRTLQHKLERLGLQAYAARSSRARTGARA